MNDTSTPQAPSFGAVPLLTPEQHVRLEIIKACLSRYEKMDFWGQVKALTRYVLDGTFDGGF